MSESRINQASAQEYAAQPEPAATQPEARARSRIVVAIDTSRQSLAALEEAANLAALMQAELEGLFVEDINLLHLCGFPFCHQIGSYTAGVRRVDNRAMERELRVLAARLREETERIAQRVQVPWQFRVRRGPVVAELLDAAESAMFLSLGRAGTSRRRSLGSTAKAIVAQTTRPVLILGEARHTQPPLVLIYSDDEAGMRALDLALALAPRYGHALEIWVLPANADTADRATAGPDSTVDAVPSAASDRAHALEQQIASRAPGYAAKHESPLAYTVVPLRTVASMRARLQGIEETLSGRPVHHTLVLPNSLAELIDHHHGPTVLVP